MLLKFKTYFPSAYVPHDDLVSAQHCIDLMDLGRILLRRRIGYKYAVYIRTKNEDILDHHYYDEVDKFFYNEDLIGVEVFCKRGDYQVFRIVGYPLNPVIKISDTCDLQYKHVERSSQDLVIYFDYSRLVEKVLLHEENLPKFNFKTNKDVLVISNSLGHWGTCTAFDSQGSFIFQKVASFINNLIDKFYYKRVFIIGGSQGASAALAYSSIIKNVAHVFAAAPVEINKKNSLKHLSDLISEENLKLINTYFYEGLKFSKISLYSTLVDEHNLFHKNLSEFEGVVEYEECHDPTVDHGKCLKFYIKDIYKKIEGY